LFHLIFMTFLFEKQQDTPELDFLSCGTAPRFGDSRTSERAVENRSQVNIASSLRIAFMIHRLSFP
jgi:hypothetical protein